MTLNGIMKASIDRIEVSTRVGMGTSFQYTPYLVKVEDNRAIVEPHCISALQNAFLSDVVLASHFVRDAVLRRDSRLGGHGGVVEGGGLAGRGGGATEM